MTTFRVGKFLGSFDFCKYVKGHRADKNSNSLIQLSKLLSKFIKIQKHQSGNVKQNIISLY